MSDIKPAKPLNKYFDHTLLKADVVEADIERLCTEAKQYDFYSVCVNSCHVPKAASELAHSQIKVCSVVGFPLGAMSPAAKAFETKQACRDGADEIDMVINVGALKEKNYAYVLSDIRGVVDTAHSCSALVKVILETCLLSDDEILKACELALDAEADFVKTSTGFASSGATAHHVSLMRQAVGDSMGVKASGGIRDLQKSLEMITAGADRLGASASVSICTE